MIRFLDSSVLVKRYVSEAGSERVRTLLRRVDAATVAVSRVTFVEACAGIQRAFRAGRLDPADRDRALDQLGADFQRLQVVEVRRGLVEATRALLLRWPLRAYDAVQLASGLRLRAAGAAVDFWCADATLSAAARGEGLRATTFE